MSKRLTIIKQLDNHWLMCFSYLSNIIGSTTSQPVVVSYVTDWRTYDVTLHHRLCHTGDINWMMLWWHTMKCHSCSLADGSQIGYLSITYILLRLCSHFFTSGLIIQQWVLKLGNKVTMDHGHIVERSTWHTFTLMKSESIWCLSRINVSRGRRSCKTGFQLLCTVSDRSTSDLC